MVHGQCTMFHGAAAMTMTVCWCMLISPVIQFVRMKTGSILPVAVLVGMMKSDALFLLLFVVTFGYRSDSLFIGVYGVAGLAALLIINLLLVVYSRRRPDQFVVAEK
jgi:hypothetical protein